MNGVQDAIRDLRSGAAKVCPQCGQIKPISNFKDRSLVTGLGRFCLECKAHPSSGEPISVYIARRVKTQGELSKGDIDKLRSFSESPEKYAAGTGKTSKSIKYLESLKHKFNKDELALYNTALKKYEAAIASRKTVSSRKADYSAILANAFNNHRSVKIRYKGSWRTIDPYSLNQTYVVAYCHFASAMRTFRVDRIQGAELLGAFEINRSFQGSAQSKLVEAPKYKWQRNYQR